MKIVGKTDIGLHRDSNQDAFRIMALGPGAGFAVVCDGMGGENGGERASSIAKKAITQAMEESFSEDLTEEKIKPILLRALYSANSNIYRIASEHPELSGMGTTAVLTFLFRQKAFCATVGDSRIYLFSKDAGLCQLSKDHSRVQDLLDRGEITPEEAKNHSDRNKLTRAVGINESLEIDFFDAELLSGERLLLCSDGLTSCVEDEEIGEILSQYSLEEAAETLIHRANDRGGYDNITVVIVEG